VTGGLLRRLVREPLVHFAVIGGLLFLAFGRGSGEAPRSAAEIVVSRADADRIAAGFRSTWGRNPSATELQGAINDFVREEVLYRTGLSLGLDRDDTIVRRRIRQKMEFFFEDTIPSPTEAELRAFFEANAEKFREEPRLAFRQIFFSERRADPAADAHAVLARLGEGDATADAAGDPMLLPTESGLLPLARVRAQYGDAFVAAVRDLEPGRWAGPVRSAYGQHLVRVTAREPAWLPSYETLRGVVQREWYAARRAAVVEEQYRKLLSGFRVRMEHAEPAAVPK
jgi:hypothetical protein